MDKIEAVCEAVKKRIIPTRELRRAVETRAEELRVAVERECRKAGLAAEVRLDGSVAKDTWLREHAEADVFMRVSPQLTKADLRNRCLPIARKALRGHEIIERFAEHPYLESTLSLDGSKELRVNVVPCYKVEKGNWLSATDRSPYHTEYIQQHLAASQHDEVRLLKAFMRGIGAYGADIKTGGFSGMLCETLITSRGEFRTAVQDFAKWHGGFIDNEKQYRGRAEEIPRIFAEPLVVIDPVDKGRNLAAAVRQEQLWNFVAASRHFTINPSRLFFFEPKIKPLAANGYRRNVRARGSTILCIATGRINAVVDILWSQLYRTQRALSNLLKNNDFNVIKSSAWSDEKSLNVILFELERGQLPLSKRHNGPPVYRLRESSSFLSKHMHNADTLSGPWIEAGRWVVQKRRTTVSARSLLKSALRSGGGNIGVARLLARSMKSSLRILEGEQISVLIASNVEFAKMMRIYLSGRPTWLA